MARNNQQPQRYRAIFIDTTENGFVVRAYLSNQGGHFNGEMADIYSFESFAGLTKWASKNVVNGGA